MLLFSWWIIKDSLSKKWSESCLWTEIVRSLTRFVQKNLSKFTNFLQTLSQLQNPGMMLKYGSEKQHKGTQLFSTSGKGAQPLL